MQRSVNSVHHRMFPLLDTPLILREIQWKGNWHDTQKMLLSHFVVLFFSFGTPSKRFKRDSIIHKMSLKIFLR